MSRRHITIFACDDVPEPDRSRHGDVPEQVGKHLRAVADLNGWDLTLDVIDVRAEAPPAASHRTDLYVFSGSAAAPFDDLPWIARLREWVVDAHQRKARMFGICFGHQVIAEALGGTTGRATDWEVGAVALRQLQRLQPAGMITPVDPDERVQSRLLMSHQDEVKSLPAGATRWLSGDFCVEQGFVIPGRIVTVQGHPEYWTAQICDLYERRRDKLGNERTDAAQRSAAQPHDGLSVTTAAIRHLTDAR